MKERIRSIMNGLGMSQQEFAQKLGISPASLSNILGGRTNPTNTHVMAVHRAFPDISVNWLIFGEGSMYAEGSSGADTASGTGEDGLISLGTTDTESEKVPNDLFSAAYQAGLSSSSPVSTSQLPPRERDLARRAAVYEQKNTNVVDKPRRKIKEIRVFFDDGTYEAFVPSSGK